MVFLLDDLLSWCDEHGFCPSPKIELVNFGGLRGRGVRAKGDISNGEMLFKVPHQWRIVGEATPAKLTSFERTAIALEKERRRGSISVFAPYISFLDSLNPATTLHQPLIWNDEELRELRGCSIEPYIGRSDHEVRYENTIEPELKSLGMEMTRAQWFHLLALVQAYAFSGGVDDSDSNVLMTPLADVLNASVTLNNARAFEDEGSGGIVMRAIEEIQAGSEIFNIFGELSNGELLRHYGYVESPEFGMPLNPFDEVEISGKSVAQVVENLLLESTRTFTIQPRKEITRQDLLRTYCDYDPLESERVCFPFGHHSSGYSGLRSLRALLRAVVISDKDIVDAIASGDDADTSIQNVLRKEPIDATEAAVREALQRITELELQKYETSLETDREALQVEGLPLRKKMALVVRMKEKELLMQMVEWLSKIGDDDYEVEGEDIEEDDSDEEEGSADEEEGSADEEEESADEEQGSADEEQGSADEEQGSADEEQGSADEEEGSADEEEGSADEEQGSAEAVTDGEEDGRVEKQDSDKEIESAEGVEGEKGEATEQEYEGANEISEARGIKADKGLTGKDGNLVSYECCAVKGKGGSRCRANSKNLRTPARNENDLGGGDSNDKKDQNDVNEPPPKRLRS